MQKQKSGIPRENKKMINSENRSGNPAGSGRKTDRQITFDIETAESITETFFYTTGIVCILYDETGREIFRPADCPDPCGSCPGKKKCRRLHAKGMSLAHRFGGRYIYDCPEYMTFCASPIIIHGNLSGALICGPAMMDDSDSAAEGVPYIRPAVMKHVSEQLFADATYISDSTHDMYLRADADYIYSGDNLSVWLPKSIDRHIDAVYTSVYENASPAVRSALHFINIHSGEKIKLADTASSVGYSESRLSHLLTEECGKTFTGLLNEIRIEKARQLLLSGRISNAEISSRTGFTDQSYFCKVFRRYTGTTPDDYRTRSRRIAVEKEYGES